LVKFNVKENQRGNQEWTNNPEKQTLLGKEDTRRRQTKQKTNTTQKAKNMNNTEPTKHRV